MEAGGDSLPEQKRHDNLGIQMKGELKIGQCGVGQHPALTPTRLFWLDVRQKTDFQATGFVQRLAGALRSDEFIGFEPFSRGHVDRVHR